MKIKTQSFTLRIPVDLLEQITKQTGQGSRSEFIIDTLRSALSTETNIDSGREKAEILLQFEIFKTEIWSKINISENSNTKILERLESLESTVSQQISNSKTNRKTESIANDEVQKTGLVSLVNQASSVKAQEINELDLIELLKKEEPGQQWSIKKMTDRRRKDTEKRKGSIDRIHSAGTYRFIYKEATKEDGKIIHIWQILTNHS
jgi:Arc/MetJ-type ribon-helix-helix transcriptional regulator